MKVYFSFLLASISLFACKDQKTQVKGFSAENVNATVYFNGDILTMEGDAPQYAAAIAVKDGKIIYVGSKEEAMRQAGSGHQLEDLQGQTLMPGFVDAHAHLLMAAHYSERADLTGTKSVAEVVQRLQDFAKTNPPPKGQWVLGFGYRPSVLAENRHPTAGELDAVLPGYPVFIVDQSEHSGAVNTAVLQLAGVTKNTKDPSGGRFGRAAGSQVPNGTVEETALLIVKGMVPEMPKNRHVAALKKAEAIWTRNGYTTATEGLLGSSSDDISLVETAIREKALSIDLVGHVIVNAIRPALQLRSSLLGDGADLTNAALGGGGRSANPAVVTNQLPGVERGYLNRVRLGGIKLWLDGAPLTYTAWLKEPYASVPKGMDPHFTGISQMSDTDVQRQIDTYYGTRMQIMAHCNGDAAAEQLIGAVEKTVARTKLKDARLTVIHAGLITLQQQERMGKLKMIASFTMGGMPAVVTSVKQIFGPQRSQFINASKSMTQNGVVITFNSDYPAGFTHNPLASVEAAVTRKSLDGKSVLAAEQAISVFDALRAITINAAYQFFEEGAKGTIKAGKLADLVMLDKNPLKVSPDEIENIKIQATIKEGKKVYEAAPKLAMR